MLQAVWFDGGAGQQGRLLLTIHHLSVDGVSWRILVPDLEAGNMLAKSLSFLAGADAAGIVLGARVPIILTSRADSVTTRLASCAVAALVAKARREAGKIVG